MRRQCSKISTNAADQASAASGDEDSVKTVDLPEQLYGYGSLPGYHLPVVVRRYVSPMGLRSSGARSDFGIKGVVADHADARPVSFDLLPLGLGDL